MRDRSRRVRKFPRNVSRVPWNSQKFCQSPFKFLRISVVCKLRCWIRGARTHSANSPPLLIPKYFSPLPHYGARAGAVHPPISNPLSLPSPFLWQVALVNARHRPGARARPRVYVLVRPGGRRSIGRTAGNTVLALAEERFLG